MSLYGDYLTERTNDQIFESESGFITFRYIGPDKVYIVDIYVVPEARKLGYAGAMADHVAHEAKAKGCTRMIGSVVPSTKGSTTSLAVLLGYGMALESSRDDFIVFGKDI